MASRSSCDPRTRGFDRRIVLHDPLRPMARVLPRSCSSRPACDARVLHGPRDMISSSPTTFDPKIPPTFARGGSLWAAALGVAIRKRVSAACELAPNRTFVFMRQVIRRRPLSISDVGVSSADLVRTKTLPRTSGAGAHALFTRAFSSSHAKVPCDGGMKIALLLLTIATHALAQPVDAPMPDAPIDASTSDAASPAPTLAPVEPAAPAVVEA